MDENTRRQIETYFDEIAQVTFLVSMPLSGHEQNKARLAFLRDHLREYCGLEKLQATPEITKGSDHPNPS